MMQVNVQRKHTNLFPRRSMRVRRNRRLNDAISLMLARVDIPVQDINAMRDFYQQVFGVQGEFAPRSLRANLNSCVFALPFGEIALNEAREGQTSGRASMTFNVGSVEAVDRVCRRMEAIEGARIIRMPHYAEDNHYELLLVDPEGNRIRFFE